LTIPDSHLSEEFSLMKRGVPWVRQPNTVTLAPFSVDCGGGSTSTCHSSDRRPFADEPTPFEVTSGLASAVNGKL